MNGGVRCFQQKWNEKRKLKHAIKQFRTIIGAPEAEAVDCPM